MPVVVKDENLVKEQMKVIDKLQEEIKLLKFDRMKNSKTITMLKEIIKRRKKVTLNVLEQLEQMEDIKLKKVIHSLKMVHIREGEDDEQ